jgi:hypothetical protein
MNSFLPVEAVLAAASHLEREWGESRRIATTDIVFSIRTDRDVYTFYGFECAASDGARWLIGSTRYGLVCHADDVDALKLAAGEAAKSNDAYFATLED